MTAGARPGAQLVDAVVSFATRSNAEVPVGMAWRRMSRIFASWDGDETVRGRDGHPLPCEVDLSAPKRPFRFAHPQYKHSRTEGTLNEMWRHGLRVGAHVDMQDARRYGVAATGAPETAVVTYCRRPGSAGLVLWPLPGYHTPGSSDFPSLTTEDTVPFAEKLDSVAWRGNLTGRALPELGPGGAGNEHAADLVPQLGGGGAARALAALDTVPRFRVLNRLAGRSDSDVGLVLGNKWSDGDLPEPVARFVRPRMEYADLFRHRYLLSLSGNDSASNFLMTMASNSVVLREEDGWELFYDGLFRAWEHYIPLQRGGDDLDERLDWARSHARECEEMSASARATVVKLVRPINRRAYLNGIREVYESRYRPRS